VRVEGISTANGGITVEGEGGVMDTPPASVAAAG